MACLIDASGKDVVRKSLEIDVTDRFGMIDEIKRQYKEYQTEILPHAFTVVADVSAKKQNERKSYWREAYAQIGLDIKDTAPKTVNVDQFWLQVMMMKGDDGRLKYKSLSLLMLAVCIISHGNSDPERGFSKNTHVLKVHGTAISEVVLEGIRIVKDFITLHRGIENITVDRKLLNSCKQARQRYHEELKLQKEAEEREEQARKEMERKQKEDKAKSDHLLQMENDLKSLTQGITFAQELLADGQQELEDITKCTSVNVNMVKLMAANLKISAGMKRKAELEKERDWLRKKMDTN